MKRIFSLAAALALVAFLIPATAGTALGTPVVHAVAITWQLPSGPWTGNATFAPWQDGQRIYAWPGPGQQSQTFPQTLIGAGDLQAVVNPKTGLGFIPCNQWAQVDYYKIDNKADTDFLMSLLVGRVLTYGPNGPQDSAIYSSDKDHGFKLVYGGDCQSVGAIQGHIDCQGVYVIYVSAQVWGDTHILVKINDKVISDSAAGDNDHSYTTFSFTGVGAVVGDAISATVEGSTVTGVLGPSLTECPTPTPTPTPAVTPTPTATPTPTPGFACPPGTVPGKTLEEGCVWPSPTATPPPTNALDSSNSGGSSGLIIVLLLMGALLSGTSYLYLRRRNQLG